MPRQHLVADMVVQGLGLASALVGGAVLLVMAARDGDDVTLAAVAVYGASLACMFICSILNAAAAHPERKAALRAWDHASIYLLIAGTYTPFCLLVVGGGLGWGLLAGIWATAILGILAKTVFYPRFARARIMVYVLMGWSGVLAAHRMWDRLPVTALALLLSGGLIYTLAAPMHRMERVPYHSAIWHGCVVSAAGLHWGAILMAVQAAAA